MYKEKLKTMVEIMMWLYMSTRSLGRKVLLYNINSGGNY